MWGCLEQRNLDAPKVMEFHKSSASEYYNNALALAQNDTDLVSHKFPHRLPLSLAKFSMEVEKNRKKSLETLISQVRACYPVFGKKLHKSVNSSRLGDLHEEMLYQHLVQTVKALDHSSEDVIFGPDSWLNQSCSCAKCQPSQPSVNDLLKILKSFMRSVKK